MDVENQTSAVDKGGVIGEPSSASLLEQGSGAVATTPPSSLLNHISQATSLHDALCPLRVFYERRSLSLPNASAAALPLPQPYDKLLRHDTNMTPTLEKHHGGRISVQVFDKFHTDQVYCRLVRLQMAETGRPVELGAILINLSTLPPACRDDIVNEVAPVGTLLRRHSVSHYCHPTHFFSVDAAEDAIMSEVLCLKSSCPGRPSRLFGRRNTLVIHSTHQVLAEVVEILPPEPETCATNTGNATSPASR